MNNRMEKGILEAFYRLIVKDEKGEIISDTGEQRSHSFVLQFLEAFYAMASETTYSITLIDSTELDWSAAIAITMVGGAGDVYTGIVVGTGTAAEANTDYAMSALIAHGTGAGQLQYGSQAFTAPAVAGSNVDFVTDRSFINGSGASISVTEIGVHVRPYGYAGASYCRLAIRDLLSSSVAIGNGLTLTVQYILRTTV